MKTLYLDCGMGAAGDMLCAALLELLPDSERFVSQFNTLGIPGVEMIAEPSVKCGFHGTHVSMRIRGQEEDSAAHAHSRPGEIQTLIEGLSLPDVVKEDVLAVYASLAEAESKVHGVPVTDIHFHEVGSLDAVADVTAVCLLMQELSPEREIASPVHVGSGQVRCAHGLLPVPAPATAELLKGIPSCGGEIRGELCTPTGAALLRHFADGFGPMPEIQVEAVGYGMGKKDFVAANCLRAFLGETNEDSDTVLELTCNVDDMTGEEIAFCCERLFDAGARDVYTLPISMKKGRPGTMICFLCDLDKRDALLQTLFRYSTTIGVRETPVHRWILHREQGTIETRCGSVGIKFSNGFGVRKDKLEYEDLRRIALERDITLRQARELVEKNC